MMDDALPPKCGVGRRVVYFAKNMVSVTRRNYEKRI